MSAHYISLVWADEWHRLLGWKLWYCQACLIFSAKNLSSATQLWLAARTPMPIKCILSNTNLVYHASVYISLTTFFFPNKYFISDIVFVSFLYDKGLTLIYSPMIDRSHVYLTGESRMWGSLPDYIQQTTSEILKVIHTALSLTKVWQFWQLWPLETEKKMHLFELVAQPGDLRMQHLCKTCQCNKMILCLNFCTRTTSRCLWTEWALFDYTSQWWTQQVQGPKTQLYLFRGSVTIVAQSRVIQLLKGIRAVSDVCNCQIFFTSDFSPSVLHKWLDVKHRPGHGRTASRVWPL